MGRCSHVTKDSAIPKYIGNRYRHCLTEIFNGAWLRRVPNMLSISNQFYVNFGVQSASGIQKYLTSNVGQCAITRDASGDA